VKRIALLSLLVAAACARGDVAETQIRSAFADLSSHPSFHIRLTGTDEIGGKQKQLETHLYWLSSSDEKGNAVRKLECSEWVDGVLTTKIVADGTTMWALDVGRNQYTVATYGTYGAGAPSNYVRGLVLAFTSSAKGPTQYLARLLSDLFAAGGVQYTPWLKSNVAGEPTDISIGAGWVSYLFGNPVHKWMRYTLWPDGYGNFILSSFDLKDTTTVGGKTRNLSWLAEVDTVTEPPAGTFTFTRPAGSHAVVKGKAINK
jgi:hypothetical protein